MRIDVSEVLLDPDFVDDVVHITRVSTTNGLGENVIQECRNNTFGCVQPANGKTINRLPELFRVANLMSFWLQSKIVTSEPGKYSDLLVYRGQTFQVQNVFDWTSWGEGWCEGTCIAQVPAP
jgi:hypothetical protein